MAMPEQSAKIIGFRSFEIDLSRWELRDNGDPIDIEPQVLDLIAYFAQHQGRVLNRDEIIDAIWGGRIVSDAAISTKIKDCSQRVSVRPRRRHWTSTG